MKCPNCSTKNIDDAKFCSKCGAKLEILCPICRNINVQDSLFCIHCGFSLKETSKAEKPQIEYGSERKHVTILFSDVSGYTAMTERLDPEEVKDIMSRIFGEIAQVITKYEGFIFTLKTWSFGPGQRQWAVP